MHAAFVEALGPVASIRYGPLPDPVPGPGELLVRVLASAVDPVDTFVRSGGYRTPVPLPLVLGRDLVGVIVAAGAGVEHFNPGEWIWSNSLGYDHRQGAAATAAVVPAERAYRLPAGVDPLRAVAVAHPGATAAIGLIGQAGLRRGERLVVVGANGAVGSCAMQIARELGARPVAVVRRPEAAARCRRLGAEVVIVAADPGPELRRTWPQGVDVFWDTSGTYDLQAALDLLAVRGRLLISAGRGKRAGVELGAFYTRDLQIRGFAMSRATAGELAAAAARLNAMLAVGRLQVPIGDVLPLPAAAEAHRRMEESLAGGPRLAGRLLLRPWPRAG